jgi:hypothetical protein
VEYLDYVQLWFEHNMDAVFPVYGFVFLSMGNSILARPHRLK